MSGSRRSTPPAVFWAAAAADGRLSAPMCAISCANGVQVAEVVAPLQPAAPTR